MNGRFLGTLGLTLVMLLAGCADKSDAAIPEDDPTLDSLELETSETTGVIRGVVVDDAIRPMINVNVTVIVQGEKRVSLTNKDGAFGFGTMPPGSHLLTASKAGFFEKQVSASVVVGDARPPAIKIQLEANPATQPYVQPFVYNGFIECTTSVLVVCGAPNLLSGFACDLFDVCQGDVTNDRYTPTMYFDYNATLIQTEMVWESSQSLSPELFLQQEALDAGCEGNRTLLLNAEGPSPVLAPVPGQTLAEGGIGGPDCGIYYSVFSGGVAESPPVPGVIGPVGIGATFQQDIQLFVHAFYHFLPPEDWRFTSGGEPVVPE